MNTGGRGTAGKGTAGKGPAYISHRYLLLYLDRFFLYCLTGDVVAGLVGRSDYVVVSKYATPRVGAYTQIGARKPHPSKDVRRLVQPTGQLTKPTNRPSPCPTLPG